MTNIPYICAFIPPHVLRHVADTGIPDHSPIASATLDQMQIVAQERKTFIPPVVTVSTKRKRRNVYDARHRRTLPGKLVLSEHRKRPADVEVNEAYDGAGATYDFLATLFGRNSIDGRGLRIDSTVHYGIRFANAMWNGSQIVYGDGDGQLFNRFTSAVDVIAHELMHGVTQYTAALAYNSQSGALNEHLSDAFGIMVKQFMLDQSAAESNWLVGEGLLSRSVNGRAIRSMAAPGTAYDDPVLGRDPQPSHMRDYVERVGDGGGIHINSGIPNHAFYLAAKAIGGYTWSVIGRVWYETLTTRLGSNDGFQQFANATTEVAGELFGFGGHVQASIAAAWDSVGLTTPVDLSARLPIKRPLTTVPETTKAAAKWRHKPVCAIR